MKRKIIQLAEKTLVVSLPSDWVKKNNLSKGDYLDCKSHNANLLLIPDTFSSPHSSIKIDISDMSERVLRWQISSFHKQGYNEIEIVSYSKEQYKVIEELVSKLFVGFIIKDKSKLRIVVGQVAEIETSEFDSSLRRAFRLLLTSAKDTLESFKTNNADLLQEQVSAEQNNNKLTNFCERLLNKSLDNKNKGHFWYVIAWNLEKVADNFKYIANHYKLAIPSLSKDTVELFESIIEYMEKYYAVFYDFSFEKMVEVSLIKKELEKKALSLLSSKDSSVLSSDEMVLIHYLDMIVLQMADFSASTIAIRFNSESE
ncbi:MAG: hypothetical protein ACQESC_01300 [Nanobdellota archaeon]